MGHKIGGYGSVNQANACSPPLTPEQCTQDAAKDYAQFYYVDSVDGKLACMTTCTLRMKSKLNCHQGKCQLQQSGPRCL